MEKQRCNLTLDSDVIEMLDEMAGSERKRGLWISNMIRTTYAAQRSNADVRTMDVEGLRLTVLGLAGRLQAVEGEMMRTQAYVKSKVTDLDIRLASVEGKSESLQSKYHAFVKRIRFFLNLEEWTPQNFADYQFLMAELEQFVETAKPFMQPSEAKKLQDNLEIFQTLAITRKDDDQLTVLEAAAMDYMSQKQRKKPTPTAVNFPN